MIRCSVLYMHYSSVAVVPICENMYKSGSEKTLSEIRIYINRQAGREIHIEMVKYQVCQQFIAVEYKAKLIQAHVLLQHKR